MNNLEIYTTAVNNIFACLEKLDTGLNNQENSNNISNLNEYKIRVMEAEAALKDAQAGATVINATLNTTQTTASVYDASIAEIEVRLAKLEKDRKRYENLVKRNAATPIQLEQIVTDYEATRKKLEATKRQKKAALSGVDEVSYRRMNTEADIQRATDAL